MLNSGQAPIARGLLGALLLALAGATALLPLVYAIDLGPSPELLRAIAQIGATLLVAYAIEVSWLLQVSEHGGRRREDWVGYVTGIGIAGLLGLALALILSAAETSSLGIGAQFVLSWALFSLTLLGLLVALLPLFVYERSAAGSSEDPDQSTELDETRELDQ